MTTERSFTNTPDAPAQARRFVAGLLGEVPRVIADEIAIMVSELATNCVRHTVTDFVVSVDRTPDEIRVDVTDTGGGAPEVRSPDLSEPSGRGLRIVQELSDSFGVRPLRGSSGKTVWFVVRIQDHLTGSGTRATANGSDEAARLRPDPGSGARPRATRADGSTNRPEASCGRRPNHSANQAGLPASRPRTLE
jgi:anti-sigma regulatory factor (Ser/Thr protein kinase)